METNRELSRRRLADAIPTLLAVVIALAQPSPSRASDLSDELPARLSETGLYAADGQVDPRHLAYSPQYPLWTDGAQKSRWIALPPGTRVDVSDVDAWQFPVGTKLWKEFAWHGHKVETRMLWKTGDERWTFASYAWDADQREAWLAPAEGVPRAIEIAPGRWHSIPARADCQTCHGSSPVRVLGFSALELSDDRDPLAPHAEPLRAGDVTLRSLIEANLLEPSRPELVTHPPRIRASDPVARAALGYLSTNCGGCHNPASPLARLGLELRHDSDDDASAPEPAERTTVDVVPMRYTMPGVPAEVARLVAPGAPEHSAVLHRMRSRRPSSQMPPLGTTIVDDEAVALVTRWITGLGPIHAS